MASSPDQEVGIHRDLPVEAGLLHADYVGYLAYLLEPLRVQDDPELRGVVEHDRQGAVVREQVDVVDHLLLGLGDEVRGTYDQEVEADRLRVVREGQHLLDRGVADVGADGPLAAGLVADHVVDADALLAGQAPELAHAPRAAGAARAEAADVPDVGAQPLFVELVIWGEGRDEGGPMASEVLVRPLARFVTRVVCHSEPPDCPLL